MAQRLLRRLRSSCKREVECPPVPCIKKRISGEDLAKDWKLYRPVGCDSCRGKGFKGRSRCLRSNADYRGNATCHYE